jgi:hypothetical protein
MIVCIDPNVVQKMTQEDAKRFRELNKKWVAGGKIGQLKLAYNSQVEATLSDGRTKTGCIVSAELTGNEPVYTIEPFDGGADFECAESRIKTLRSN